MARSPDWTEERVTFLREHYALEGPVFCSEELDTSLTAVTRKAEELQLSPPEKRKGRYQNQPRDWSLGICVPGWGWNKPSTR